jgi:hypothetical protein
MSVREYACNYCLGINIHKMLFWIFKRDDIWREQFNYACTSSLIQTATKTVLLRGFRLHIAYFHVHDRNYHCYKNTFFIYLELNKIL